MSQLTCEPKVNLQPYQSPSYSNYAAWPDMASSSSDSAPACMPWYASPAGSDGRRTSDFSPVSGYFDWSHSSNNTSPLQHEEIVHKPSPAALPHPSRIGPPNQSLPFITSYPNGRRSSHHDAPSTANCPHPPDFAPIYQDCGNPALLPDQETTHGLTSPVSPEPLAEPASESNAKEVVENEDGANSRNGKRWKAAHRAVERRYRSNLNLKIVKLGQCIPAIRSQVLGIEDLESAEDARTTPKAKLQKGHVLSKAVDYIQSLQQRVYQLEAERRQLEDRVEALHELVEEEHQPSAEIIQCNKAPELPSRDRGLERLSDGEPKTGLTIVLKQEELGTKSLSSERQSPMLPRQNGFSVSRNSSFTPRVTTGPGPWQSST